MNQDYSLLFEEMKAGSQKALAKLITAVENHAEKMVNELSAQKNIQSVPVIGITGPPGAGKSSLVNSLLNYWVSQDLKIAIVAIDPSSPFNLGALLGDRLRMSAHYTNPKVYIRSMASRGALGGLSQTIIEVVDLLKIAGFDRIVIETVGVGQSEIEIAGLADTTVLVLVPEAGDEVQAIKSGIMEIADIFVVNKADRIGADLFCNNIKNALHQRTAREWNPPVIKTIATSNEGIEELDKAILNHSMANIKNKELKAILLADKALKLISEIRLRDINKQELLKNIKNNLESENFNLYSFVQNYTKK